MHPRYLTSLLIFSFVFIAIQPMSTSFVSDSSVIPESDFDNMIHLVMEVHNLPNFECGIIKDQQLIWSNGYSLNKRFDPTPDADTIFLAGSMSKTPTAIAVLQLQEQEILDLDEDINEYLPFSLRHPDYPDIPITLRMLLSHASGLQDEEARLFFYFSILGYSNAQLEEYLLPGGAIYRENIWGDWEPGTGSFYSSIGFEIIEYIIDLTTDTTFPEYCQENIFETLHMNNTSYTLDGLDRDLFSPIYWHFPGAYIRLPIYEDHNYAAGSMKTTINDLSKLLIAINNNGTYQDIMVLQPKSVQDMRTIQYPDAMEQSAYVSSNRRYGLGWLIHPEEQSRIDLRYEGHDGAVPGGIAGMYFHNDIGIIYFGNQWTIARYLHVWCGTTILKTLFERAGAFEDSV